MSVEDYELLGFSSLRVLGQDCSAVVLFFYEVREHADCTSNTFCVANAALITDFLELGGRFFVHVDIEPDHFFTHDYSTSRRWVYLCEMHKNSIIYNSEALFCQYHYANKVRWYIKSKRPRIIDAGPFGRADGTGR